MSTSALVRTFPGLPRHYRVERLLGEGFQKQIYLAEDTRAERRVAIAVLRRDTRRRPAIERLHEVRAMARLGDHPHVVSIYDVLEGPESLYIVSQYLAGGDLETRLAARVQRAIPVLEALRIASDICAALEHAHENGVAHCDVKPGNIFLDERDTALLGDFGFAELSGTVESNENQITGTPAYLAPEQITNAVRGPSCDLYALGCLLYELTTGRPPFAAASAADLLRLHQVARPTPPVDRDRAIPWALSDLVLKLLEKEPSARPASVRDVRAALAGIRDLAVGDGGTSSARSEPFSRSRPGSTVTPTAPEPELVAREEPMRLLATSLERARRGTPGFVLIAGEAGIGKSRVLRELRRSADDCGCLVLFGQAYPDAPVPFRPLVDALLPIAGRLSELEPERAELLREFLYLDRGAPQPEGLTEREARHHRLFSAVFAALASFSTPRPLLLMLDDLHWADSASLDLFEHLAFALSQRSSRPGLELLVVGSFRPADADPRLSAAIERIDREPVVQRIALSPLDESGVFAAVTALGIERPSGRLVHRVQEATAGNPLFIREVVDHLVRSRKLTRQNGFTIISDPTEELELPSSVTSAIAARTSQLSEHGRELLTLAAFLGTRFELDRLAAISGSSLDALAPFLDEAVSLGFLLDEGHVHRFTHPLVQQVMSRGPSAELRQQLHLRIAEQLQLAADAESPATDLEVAFHLVRAGSLADSTQIMRYASRAAEHALARYAWHEATDLLEAAISAASTAPGLSVLDIAELHRRAGLAYFRRSDSGPCVHHYDTAAEAFASAGDVAGLARALNDRTRAAVGLGLIHYGGPSDVKPLEDVLEQVGTHERSLRAQISSTLAESYWATRQMAAAERNATKALELAGEISDHRLFAEASLCLGLICFQSFRVEEALSIWREGQAHARRIQDLFMEERCLQRIVLALLASGHLDDAEQTALAVEGMNRILQVPGESSLTSSSLLAIATVRGDLAAAERHGRDALDQVRRAKYPWTALMTVGALASARAWGDPAHARQTIGSLGEPGIAFEDPRFFEPVARELKTLIDCLSDDAGRLEAITGIDRDEPLVGFDLNELRTLCTQVELADALQSPTHAAGIGPILQAAEENGVLFMNGWPFFVPRLRGIVALLEGALEAAVTHLERAIEVANRAGARPERSRSMLDLARALSVRDGLGDRSRAHELLERAIPQLRVFFPGAVLARAEKLSAFLDGDQS